MALYLINNGIQKASLQPACTGLTQHYGQPIDCADRNSSNATKIYLDISTRFLKCFFAKSVLSHNSDTYLDVMRCHQLLEGVSLVNHQSRNIDSRFRNDFGAGER